jgi:hypothetical protein
MIGSGAGLTTIVRLTEQPVRSVYVIVADTGATPVSTPLKEPMVATVASLLVHVPSPNSNNVTDWPGQI